MNRYRFFLGLLYLAFVFLPFVREAGAEAGLTITAVPLTIPILAYHRFSEDTKSPLHHLDTFPKDFREQMTYLKEQGYQTVNLDIFLKENQGKSLPSKPIIITIDDGFQSIYSVAFPLLKKMGLSATAFVCPRYIGSAPALVTWKECKEMLDAGFSVECHTFDHEHMSHFNKDETPQAYVKRISDDLSGSKKMIEEKLGTQVRHFAYPYGDYNEVVEKLTLQAGYGTICLATEGMNSFFGANPYRLKRFFVDRNTSFKWFKKVLETGVLEVGGIEPLEGALLVKNKTLTLKAVLLEPEKYDLSTLRLQLGDVPYAHAYDQESHVVKCTVPFSPRESFHTATVSAQEKGTGKTCTYAWSFAIKSQWNQDMDKKIARLVSKGSEKQEKKISVQGSK